MTNRADLPSRAWRVALIILTAIVVHTSPAPARTQTAGLESRFRELADSTAAGRFAAQLASAFAPTGVYLAAGPALQRGSAGALAALGRDTMNAVSRANWWVTGISVSGDGRDGYAFGFLDVIRPAGDTLPGRFHSYWRRTDSGRWEILAFVRAPTSSSRIAKRERVPPLRGAAANPADTAKLLESVYATELAFSDLAASSVAGAFAFYAAEGASKSARDAYLVGPAAIAELFAAVPAGSLGPVWTPEWGSVARSGDLAFTLGPAWPRVAGAVQTKPTDLRGRYFTIWIRQADGSWRWVVD